MMLLNSSENEKLFAKSVPISIKDVYTNQTRSTTLFLTIEWQDALAGMFSRKVLVISLTDDNDPFFLYNLHLSEDDFQMLKSSQELLINFGSFPQHIIDYVEMCLLEERKPQPKFLLMFTVNDKVGSVASNSQLDIIETNHFKHLTYLSLKFVAATDSAVRQYLATCFRNLKEDRRQLQNKLSFLEQDLKDKLTSCQHTLSSKSQELELLRKELSVELSMKDTKHNLELQEERSKLLNRLKDEEARIEIERKEREQSFCKQIQQLEASVSCLDTLNKELQDKNYKHDSTIRELRSNFLSSEDEIRRLKENIQSYKKKYDTMQSQLREKQSQIHQQDEKIANLEQELRNKGHTINSLIEQIDIDAKQKKSLEVELENFKLQFEMSEKSRKILEEDKTKSNEIILRLQQKVKAGFEKAKAKTELSSKHEQKLEEKEKLLQQLEKETAELNILLQAKYTEIKSLDNSVITLQKTVETLEKDLKNRDNVIKWLNRHLTDNCVVPHYTPPANLGPSPSCAAQKQLQRISSGGITSSSPDSSPIRKTATNITAPKSVSKATPSNRKRISTPSNSHRANATDSAYCTKSPSALSNPVTPNNLPTDNIDFNPSEFEIDAEALSAAFGSEDHNPKHSTAKKPVNSVKSIIPKGSKKR